MEKLIYVILILFAGFEVIAQKQYEIPTIVGEWQHIFNPNDTRSDIDTTWYTNDHCFAKGPNGDWHAYGIIGHKPINPWTGENKLFHISAKTFHQKRMKDHGYALKIIPGVERVLWAPHVYQEGGKSYMFYNIGNLQEDPMNFPKENFVCELPTHASEIVKISEDEWYISNTGWDKKGVYIARLNWMNRP